MSRPAGQRCVVVSSHGTTVSRQRNGRVLHAFPSALPNGARTRDVSAASSVFCILDCIFHEVYSPVHLYVFHVSHLYPRLRPGSAVLRRISMLMLQSGRLSCVFFPS